MYWEIALYGSLVAAGFCAGIMNTVAGGGSFLTLPALLLFGLDPQTANATNRVAILSSMAAAVATFRKHGHLDCTAARRLGPPTLLGVPVGALLAVHLPADAFSRLFGGLFIVMALLLIANPKRFLDWRDRKTYPRAVQLPVFFAIGVYAGFIQAGMGILLLLAVSYFNHTDMVASNAIKNGIGFVVTLIAAIVFAIHGMIDWLPGIVMAAGNVLGGIVGAKLAIEQGSRFVFIFLIAVMLATGLKLALA